MMQKRPENIELKQNYTEQIKTADLFKTCLLIFLLFFIIFLGTVFLFFLNVNALQTKFRFLA